MSMPQPEQVATGMYFTPGDEQAFTEIFKLFHDRLLFFANRLINDDHTAEDIVGGVFERFWRAGGTFESYYAVRVWMYLVTRNACFDYLEQKKRKVKRLADPTPLEDSEDAVLAKIVYAEVINEIHALIEQLPTQCKRIFKLSYIEGRSDKEIAGMLNLSLSTVKNQRLRGIHLLQKRLIKANLWELVIFFAIFSD